MLIDLALKLPSYLFIGSTLTAICGGCLLILEVRFRAQLSNCYTVPNYKLHRLELDKCYSEAFRGHKLGVSLKIGVC